MIKLLDGKCGIITGAGYGIGQAAAVLFAQHGAKCVISCRTEAKAQKTLELVKQAGGEAYFFPCDVRDEAQVKAMVEFTAEKLGKIDFAFNNAGVSSKESGMLHETTTEAFKDVVETNLFGVYYSMKYEIPYMLENGGGAIVNTLSLNSVRCVAGGSSYGTSKFGAYGLTMSAALEYAKQNIRINAIGPGPTKTGLLEDSIATFPEMMASLEASIPDGRFGEAIEQANAALYLLSDLATHINGHLLMVDGGMSVGL